MAVNYITYDASRRKIAVPVTSRAQYLALRDSEANRRAEKRRLVQMNYSLTGEGEFPLRGAQTVGNGVGMDVDHIEDADAVAARILEQQEAVGLLMLEKSVSGAGLHLVFRRHAEMSHEENLRWASRLLGVEYDKGAKDVTRVFFTPPSDKLLWLDDELFCRTPAQADEATAKADEATAKAAEAPAQADEATAKAEAPAQADEATAKADEAAEVGEQYLGIPYTAIIDKYWELFYDAQTPVKSNRDTLTYELANVMKHICGFDRELLRRVIPCYDGFPEAEKMKCIDSALSGKRTQMPRRLREVLTSLTPTIKQGEQAGDYIRALDDLYAHDELHYYRQIPQAVMVQGIKESIEAAGSALCMPVLTAICPAIGARATGVQLVVHGKPNTLNLIAYIAGDFASGKGQMDDVVKAWMAEDIEMAELYNQRWAEYAEKKKLCKNKKEQPAEPKYPKVWLTLNNTTANLAEELANVQGRHAFSFTPEADVVSIKWKSSISDFSTMIRQSYDGSSYEREARSVDAVNVHISRLLWNVVMCGTPDALYRVVSNYTDGFQSRIAVARTPDNTFAPLDEHPAHLTDLQRERIEQVSHLLPLLSGTIELPQLEERGRQWLEEVRIETMKNDDRVMARQRMRICVTAQRMTCCLMLAAVCSQLIQQHGAAGADAQLRKDPQLWQRMTEQMQTPQFLEMFSLIADSLIDNAMYFFRDRIEEAFSSRSYAGSPLHQGLRQRKGRNDSIFERLPQEFGFAEAMAQSMSIKGAGVTQNAVQQMLKNWHRQGLTLTTPEGRYRKNYETKN